MNYFVMTKDKEKMKGGTGQWGHSSEVAQGTQIPGQDVGALPGFMGTTQEASGGDTRAS